MTNSRSGDNMSGNPKRVKDSNEAIIPVKRLKKVAYFPVNNLTEPIHNKTATNTTNQRSPIRPLDPNTLKSKILPVSEIKKKNYSDQSQSQKQQELSFLQENSDDSFDGIRWKESPGSEDKTRVQGDKSQGNGLPSSPLKNICPSTEEENVDDRTADVLNKYGTIFSNSSMLPTACLSKSCSDIGQLQSNTKNMYQDIPQARRAKSGEDFRTKKKVTPITESFQSTLNSWINKFEGDPVDEVSKKSNNKDAVANATLPSEEDPFSDDDDLIQVLQTQSQVKFERALQNRVTTEAVPSDNDDSSEDPFSDDDSELMELLTAQAPTSTFSKFGRSFKNGIKNMEKLMVDKDISLDNKDELKDLVYDRPMVSRYKIIRITENFFGDQQERQFIVDVINPNNKKSKLVVRGDYCELELQKNDIIHVIVTHASNPQLIDNSHNLLIWNPDILISATSIAQQVGCPRKTVILSRYKFPGVLSKPIIIGEIVHYIFQECICKEKWTFDFMNNVLDELLKEYLLAIFAIEKNVEEIRDEVVKHFEYLETWFESYYKKPFSNSSYIEEASEKNPIKFAIEEALDIEEEIKSPMFGIKGNIDATVTARFEGNGVNGKFMVPMEIKTGKSYMYHNAQASLYALLFQDRYDFLIKSYLLVYTKEKVTQKCNIRISDLRSLIILRNKLSQYIKSNIGLPPLVKNSECDRCNIRSECMTLNHLVEEGTKEESGIGEDEYEAITKDIFDNDVYRDYFVFWDHLIACEEDFLSRTVKHLWTMTGAERQDQGKCFDRMKIVQSNDKETNTFLYAIRHRHKSDSPQFEYTFEKEEGKEVRDLLRSQLNVGDKVIISDEAGQFAITTGSIARLSRSAITINTRRRILTSDNKLKNYNNSNNQVFQSVIRQSQSKAKSGGQKTFRIDKDEMFYGLGLARYNVLNLFLPKGAAKTRRMVVDYEKPTYKDKPEFKIPDKQKFNSDQIAAMEKVFSTNDYALILGMPGTGKTTVIAELIRIMVSEGMSVLLTSYTNSAVDNILLKLKDLGVDFLRVGYPLRVHKDIHPYIPDNKHIKTYNQYFDTYNSPKVVATTCLGITDPCFNLRGSFDICIVDEASQIALPINLGPLSFSKRFVMVGDHNQLPPLVKHPSQSVKQALSQSLFKKLSTIHPESLVELTYQYRMCQDIMEVSNILIYGQRLKCGSEEVAKRSLVIPHPGVLKNLQYDKSLARESRWMETVFEPSNKVLFLDHDNLPALEEARGDSIKNYIEAMLVEQVVGALVEAGVEESQIGVMSVYRSQVLLLKRNLSLRKDIEVLTADQFQGRDKECIIISLVKSNENNNPGELLKDWRRLNVAITRAKSKLIILGSRSTLSATETTKTFIEFLEEKNWYYSLPKNAHMVYNIAAQGVPTSPVKAKRTSQNPALLQNHPILRNVIQDISN